MEAVVEYEYQAEQEDELSLKVGDVITSVITAEGGWWEGELNGKKGMFPENFVKLVKRREPSSLKKEEKREATQRKSVRELANKFKDGVPISVIPKKKEKKKKCKVLFEYKKENDDELELQVGDIIEFHKQKIGDPIVWNRELITFLPGDKITDIGMLNDAETVEIGFVDAKS